MKPISDYDRSIPLDAKQRRAIEEQLPAGHELVEGDFADDEKWRIVTPPPEPAAREGEPDPVSPPIGDCTACGGTLVQDEPRIEDGRGIWHPDCYTQPARRTTRKR